MLKLMDFSLKRKDRNGKQSLEANRSKVSVVRESGAGCLEHNRMTDLREEERLDPN